MYCSVEDILARHNVEVVRKLTQVGGTPAQLDYERVRVAIRDASALIDQKLHTRYVVPVEGSEILRKIAIDIAVYYLHRNRHDNEVPKEVKSVYVSATEFLDSVKDGRESLPGATERTVNAKVILTNSNGARRRFTDDKMKVI